VLRVTDTRGVAAAVGVTRPASESDSTGGRPRPSRWTIAVWAVAALGLALRVIYVFRWQHPFVIQGDSLYYHNGANMLAQGRGFLDPYILSSRGILVQGAQHPPLYMIALAIPSVLGLTSTLDHQLFTCLLGSISIVAVGYVGRRIGGSAVGLVAAVLAAGYPEFWINDGLLLSESMSILVTACVLLAAYRLAERRTLLRGGVLGCAVALAALTRAELLLFAVILLPLVLGDRLLTPAGSSGPPRGIDQQRTPWRRRFAVLGVGALAGVLVLAPWTIYNVSRFHRTETISSGLGETLFVANCPGTYYGPFKGYWNFSCIETTPVPPGDMSDEDIAYRHRAYEYIKTHRSALPSLAVARLGRVWGFYRPYQQLQLDGIEKRPLRISEVGLAMFYSLAIASLGGVSELWRRRVPLSPLLAPIVVVSVAAVAFLGETRFRAAAEPSMVLFGSVGIVAVAGLLRRRLPGAHPGDQEELAKAPVEIPVPVSEHEGGRPLYSANRQLER
jgi:4-amino-4-deoxy-L-arabinose transferase-like glycosyltransferase